MKPVFYRWPDMIIMKTDAEDIPFSSEILELYQAFTQATDRETKTAISLQMASVFAADHDNLDPSATEEYHEFFEAFEKAILAYEHQAHKLARLAVNLVSSYLANNETTVDEMIPTVTSASN
jgi:hypothetical protein